MVVFFLLIEVLLTRLTVSCDNWNELTCWISTAIRQPLSCLPSVPRRPRTYDPSRQLRRGYPVGLKTLMHTRLLRFQAGSSGSLARKWPSRCDGGGGCPCRARRAAPCAACPQARRTRLQPGYIEISSLLYCDNCTLIGTGLEMTRPAYRLHIVSHKNWPFLAKIIAFAFFEEKTVDLKFVVNVVVTITIRIRYKIINMAWFGIC